MTSLLSLTLTLLILDIPPMSKLKFFSPFPLLVFPLVTYLIFNFKLSLIKVTIAKERCKKRKHHGGVETLEKKKTKASRFGLSIFLFLVDVTVT